MEVTKSFLEKLLNQKVTEFTTKEGTKPGDNVAGILRCIRVTLESGVILNLVNKSISDDPEFRGNKRWFEKKLFTYYIYS
jgi:hypothetical protein